MIEVAPVAGMLGAEILGVGLSRPLNDEGFATIHQAFLAHSVIFFREQSITPARHIALARRFGLINVNRFFTPLDGHPEIAEVRKEPDQTKNIGEVWHTNHSYDAIPAPGSMLVARDAVHPVAIRHPDTGRPALYVNANSILGIEGWTREESEGLLRFLYRHGQRPEFTCRFR